MGEHIMLNKDRCKPYASNDSILQSHKISLFFPCVCVFVDLSETFPLSRAQAVFRRYQLMFVSAIFVGSFWRIWCYSYLKWSKIQIMHVLVVFACDTALKSCNFPFLFRSNSVSAILCSTFGRSKCGFVPVYFEYIFCCCCFY